MVFAAAVSSSLTQFLLLQFYIAIYFIFLFFLSLTYIRTKPMAYSYVVFNYFLYRLVHNSNLCRTDCAKCTFVIQQPVSLCTVAPIVYFLNK